MSYEKHLHAAAGVSARTGIITLSDTRTEQTDKSGLRIKELLASAGHGTADYRLIPDEPAILRPLLADWLQRDDLDLILTTGGTGISRRDQTITVVQTQIDRPLPGFGELFRMLSWDQIGSGAMLSGATGGIAREKILFCLPGSIKAVELAMQKLILPQIGHLLSELRK